MDALPDGTTDTAKPLSRAAGAIILAVILLILAVGSAEQANLVDHIPLALTFASGVAFFAGGLWLTFRVEAPTYYGSIRRVIVHVGLPLIAIFFGTFLARMAVEAVAFVGLSPVSTPSVALVIDKMFGKYGDYGATVSFGPGTREVDVEITSDLYDRLEPYRAPGRDCLRLSTQTGRWGFRRTMLPRRFFDDPVGVDRYVQCHR